MVNGVGGRGARACWARPFPARPLALGNWLLAIDTEYAVHGFSRCNFLAVKGGCESRTLTANGEFSEQ
jgi:hypothetical protein